MAHAGVGSVSFTTCLLLDSILGIKPTSVPYNGTGPALTALIAGQVDYMCDQIVNIVQQVQAGQIKAYAIGTAERSPALSDVPTSKEAGLPEFQAHALDALSPQGDAQAHRRQAVRSARQGARRRDHAQAAARAGGVTGQDRARPALGTLVKSEIAPTPIIKAAGAVELNYRLHPQDVLAISGMVGEQ
jgi:tripartite-type tricarboxylate transporter receptor subunit TctC